ncbi:alpha/beta hydrolase family protein [Gryllotalpicola ginsengisoli]|uniref:alpha/beta hydrolase family protein n=1 Tax=Gryllotalpicola ginsengisoli TaxID=444608 RepID=UPI0003B32F61|nr:alpha/beta fold hydrolase [Gryllotalpicola ginsengisoli]
MATEHPITAPDGTRTVVDEYEPAEARATVLFLPALGVPIGYYRPFFETAAGRGIRVFGLEMRGRPRTSTTDMRRHDWGYATLIEQDIPAALAQTPLAEVDRFTVVGHSLGGLLALAATGAGILRPERVITAASGAAHHTSRDGWLAQLQRRWVTPWALLVTHAWGYFPGHRLGFGDRQPKTMIGDWHREAKLNRFVLAGTDTDYEEALHHVEVPVLQLSFEGDTLVSSRAVDMLAERVSPTVPDRVHVLAAANGGAPWDHVRWPRQNADAVLDVMQEWSREHPARV